VSARQRSAGWWRLIPVVLALPILGGAGICGVVLVDITQRDLILEPADTITFDVDSGAVEVFSFNRNGVSLFYYMTGSLRDIGEVGHHSDGSTLEVVSVCERDDFCNVNWYAEIALATAVDVRAGNGGVKLTGIDAPITADVVGGGFDGVDLRATSVEVDVEAGDVTINWIDAPMTVRVGVGEGNVALTLPPGTYRCELDTADGDIDSTGVICDDTATNTVHVDVETGDIALLPGPMP
jgi:hypothetical protein